MASVSIGFVGPNNAYVTAIVIAISDGGVPVPDGTEFETAGRFVPEGEYIPLPEHFWRDGSFTGIYNEIDFPGYGTVGSHNGNPDRDFEFYARYGGQEAGPIIIPPSGGAEATYLTSPPVLTVTPDVGENETLLEWTPSVSVDGRFPIVYRVVHSDPDSLPQDQTPFAVTTETSVVLPGLSNRPYLIYAYYFGSQDINLGKLYSNTVWTFNAFLAVSLNGIHFPRDAAA